MQLGNLNLTILQSISKSEKYGLEIIEDISKQTNGQVVIKQPSLYSGLRRLEQRGLITSRWEDSELGGRRHYYSITNLGKSELQLHRPEEFLTKDNTVNQIAPQTITTSETKEEPGQLNTKVETPTETQSVEGIKEETIPNEIPTENIFEQADEKKPDTQPINENTTQNMSSDNVMMTPESIVDEQSVDKNDATVDTSKLVEETAELAKPSIFEQIEKDLNVAPNDKVDETQQTDKVLTPNIQQDQTEQFTEFNPSDAKETKRKSFSDKMRDYVEPENNYDEYKLKADSPTQASVDQTPTKDEKSKSENDIISNAEKLANSYSKEQDTVVEYVHANPNNNDDINYKDILGDLDADLNKPTRQNAQQNETNVVETKPEARNVTIDKTTPAARPKSAYEKELEEILLSSKTDDATRNLSIKETDRMEEVNRKYGTGTTTVKPDEIVEDETFSEDIHKIEPKNVGFTYLNQENITVKPYKKVNKTKTKTKTGMFLNINKLNLVRASIMFLLMALELVLVYIIGKNNGIFDGIETVTTILFSVSAVIVVLYYVVSLLYTLPNLSKKIKIESINFGIDFLYRFIMCAFIVMFVFGLNIFMGMPNLIDWLIPCIMASNLLISWLVGVIAYSTKSFHA